MSENSLRAGVVIKFEVGDAPEARSHCQMNGNTPEAYSRLRLILAEKNLSVFQLHRELNESGVPVNIKSLYRLTSDDPLQKMDLRIAAAICQACDAELGELISFEKPAAQLQHLPEKDQARLDDLMAANNEGKLSAAERREFNALAEKAHRLSLENARILQAERRRTAAPVKSTRKREPATA